MVRSRLSPPRLPGVVFLLLVVLLAAIPVTVAASVLPPRPAVPGPATSGPGGIPLSYHANLYLAIPVAAGPVPTGEEIGVTYQVLVPNFPSTSLPEYVAIPVALLLLPSAGAGAAINLPSANVTIRNASPVAVAVGPLVREPVGNVSVNQSAVVSTQGVAVTASWPFGTYAAQIRWSWTLVGPDGGRSSGPWSAWETVEPAQIAAPGRALGKTLVEGTPYPLCLSGLLAGRTFTLHLSLGANGTQVNLGNATVPEHPGVLFCWNNTLSIPEPPQSAYLHLWEIDNISFLLLVQRIQIQNTSGTLATGHGMVPPALLAMLVYPGAVVVVVIAALIAVFLLARRRSPPRVPPPYSPPLVPPPQATPTPTLRG